MKRSYALVIGLNVLAVYVFVFWRRLLYWCMEGRIPLGWLALSFLLAVVLPLALDALLIIRSGRKWPRTMAAAAAAVALALYDPILMPLYAAWTDKQTMMLSFNLLEAFK